LLKFHRRAVKAASSSSSSPSLPFPLAPPAPSLPRSRPPSAKNEKHERPKGAGNAPNDYRSRYDRTIRFLSLNRSSNCAPPPPHLPPLLLDGNPALANAPHSDFLLNREPHPSQSLSPSLPERRGSLPALLSPLILFIRAKQPPSSISRSFFRMKSRAGERLPAASCEEPDLGG